MSDLLFVIKALVATVAVVVVMQIKIDQRTIEQHSLAWIHQSVVVEQLQEVAAGAVKVGRKGANAIANDLGIREKVKRSDAYLKQKEREAQEEIERIGAEAMSTKAELN